MFLVEKLAVTKETTSYPIFSQKYLLEPSKPNQVLAKFFTIIHDKEDKVLDKLNTICVDSQSNSESELIGAVLTIAVKEVLKIKGGI